MTKTIFALGLVFNFSFNSPALAAQVPIVGGKVVKESESLAKRTVALFFIRQSADGKKSQGLCTGSILDQKRILTAAHCVEEFQSGLVIFALDGVIDWVKGAMQGDANALKVTREITSVKAEPGYLPDGGDDEFIDLAVANFNGGLPAGYVPAKFLSQADALEAVQARRAKIILAGYGITEANSMDGIGTLRKVDRKFLDLTDNLLNLWVSGSMGHDACSGDSGGPAMVTKGGEVYVVGVASRSDCEQSAIYTVVHTDNLPKRRR